MIVKKIKIINKSITFFRISMFAILNYIVAFMLHISEATKNEIYSQLLFDRSVLIFEHIVCTVSLIVVFSIILNLLETGKIK